ncbi:hypothetical protein D3C71_1665230 [compost metagenome]
MGVVHAEDAHPVLHPEQHHVAQRAPQRQLAGAARRAAIERDVDDVLVFLGRVLGIAQRPVGPPREPIGVLFQPGVVGRTLNGEVQRHFQTVFLRGAHQAQKVGQRAQLGFDGVVPAVG